MLRWDWPGSDPRLKSATMEWFVHLELNSTNRDGVVDVTWQWKRSFGVRRRPIRDHAIRFFGRVRIVNTVLLWRFVGCKTQMLLALWLRLRSLDNWLSLERQLKCTCPNAAKPSPLLKLFFCLKRVVQVTRSWKWRTVQQMNVLLAKKQQLERVVASVAHKSKGSTPNNWPTTIN